jgi:type IX secretion system PorP/SprF family membrane protein
MKYFLTAILFIALSSIEIVKSQDIHFSQFYAEPWLINPAKTGFFNGNYRLTGAYRNQWSSITAPYSTFSASGELGWELKGASKDVFGIGFHAFSDQAGDANYSVNSFGVSSAYNFGLDRYQTQFIGFGGAVNYTGNNFDPTRLKFDNEYTGISGTEQYTRTKVKYVEYAAGIEYNFIPNERFNFNCGWAMYHINEPSFSFTASKKSTISQRQTFNAGATYTINDIFQLYPRALVSFQGPHREISTGTFVRMKLDKSRKESYALYFGPWMRWKDAVILVTRFDVKELSLGLSYDINSSKLFDVSEGRGGPEFTVAYTGAVRGMSKRKVNCPKF